jgi:hypothetical protein
MQSLSRLLDGFADVGCEFVGWLLGVLSEMGSLVYHLEVEYNFPRAW